tara:strand:- start:248 stop:571 length:324 start_codon:yes stop_codon:yes gene_type:complete
MEAPSFRYLKELSNGNRKFELKIIKILIEELPSEYSSYQNALGARNFYLASEIVHKIKHKVAFFQMDKAFSLTEKHENALLAGNLNYQLDFQDIIGNILKFLPENYE